MICLGLLGKNIQHSKSKDMYEEILGESIKYVLFDFNKSADIPDINYFFNHVNGLSITAPYKEHFLKNVYVDDDIVPLQAINCIKKDNDGIFSGYNTDYLALKKLVKEYSFDINKNYLILGNGPMARIVLKVLHDFGFKKIHHVFRTNEFSINDFDMNHINDSQLNIINCCSRGVLFKPDLKGRLINIFWDLNYSQDHLYTGFSKIYINGLELLRLQAKFALNIWAIK